MTKKELLRQVQNLKKKENYAKIVSLLTDSVLKKYKDFNLYFDRGFANGELKNYQRGIDDYSKAIELIPNDFISFNNRGTLYFFLEDLESALLDYNKAIELNQEYAGGFYNRGIYYNKTGEKEKALQDFTKSIELNSNYTDAYIYRGILYKNMGEIDKALSDYSKALELNPNYALIYNNLGVLYNSIDEIDKAILNYNKAIEIDPNFALAYNNRGNKYANRQNYEKAIEDYEKAIEIDSNYKQKLTYLIDLYRSYLGEKIETNEKGEQAFYYFVNLINSLATTEEIKSELKIKCAKIVSEIIEKIKIEAAKFDGKEVVHYTKLKVADLIVSSETEAKLRYYNAVHMNDPEEGKILLKILNNKKIELSFENGKKGEENNIYIGSFLPADEHEDELIMWRTYGKDENRNEAAGCSIVIKRSFFEGEPVLKIMDYEDSDAMKKMKKSAMLSVTQNLYKVIYLHPRKKDKNVKKIMSDISMFKKELLELLKMKSLLGGTGDGVIDKIVFQMISELRYFFKSSDYSFESEYRVIQYAPFESKKVLTDDNGGAWLPRRLYIESVNPICNSILKIWLGPKVPSPSQWIYLESSMRKKGHKVEVLNSACQYQ